MKRALPFFVAVVIWVATPAVPVFSADEWGDAPEGAVAYPSLGVMGAFPTCQNVPLSFFISHGSVPPQWTYFGPMEDYEPEGNAGGCPTFPPYDADECFQDGDAGLIMPEPYTIGTGGTVIPCPGYTGYPMKDTCRSAIWGVDVDIEVHHSGNPADPGYINVLFDWNQNGLWGDTVWCNVGGVPTPVPEHVLVNFYLPAGYSGPLSGLTPPSFVVGPNQGYVWARFMVSESRVNQPWDGNGIYEGGESEDYLIEINPSPHNDPDFGDAPEGEPAYPAMGVIGQFPTCSSLGQWGWVEHAPGGLAWFGPMVDGEVDGNAGNCAVTPPFPPYDMDECFQDGDAGLIMPPSYTISGGAIVPCPAGYTGGLGAPCSTAVWGRDIDIDVVNNSDFDMYVNVLADWNRDGIWGGADSCNGTAVPEHVLGNFVVPPGFSRPLSALNPPPFVIGPDTGYVWTRFTISPTPVVGDWNGEGQFDDGESEDYLLWVSEACAGVGWKYEPARFSLLPAEPNPFTHETRVRYSIPCARRVKIAVYDPLGRQVRLLSDQFEPAGGHEVVWDATDAEGRPVTAGIYFLRMQSAGFSSTRRLVLLR